MYPTCPHLFDELEHRIHQRTNWRVRNLFIEVQPERAILRGEATSRLARQLVQQIVNDAFPHVCVENSIVVDNEIDVLPGLPLN
jgi:hypothetical protein